MVISVNVYLKLAVITALNVLIRRRIIVVQSIVEYCIAMKTAIIKQFLITDMNVKYCFTVKVIFIRFDSFNGSYYWKIE
ncbi:Protein ECM21 [Trichinella pseudospiralis]